MYKWKHLHQLFWGEFFGAVFYTQFSNQHAFHFFTSIFMYRNFKHKKAREQVTGYLPCFDIAFWYRNNRFHRIVSSHASCFQAHAGSNSLAFAKPKMTRNLANQSRRKEKKLPIISWISTNSHCNKFVSVSFSFFFFGKLNLHADVKNPKKNWLHQRTLFYNQTLILKKINFYHGAI